MVIYSMGSLYCQNLKAKIGSGGMGIKNSAKPSIHLLLNWQEFLLLNENKTELFYFLAKTRVKSVAEGKKPAFTDGHRAVQPCSGKDLHFPTQSYERMMLQMDSISQGLP